MIQLTPQMRVLVAIEPVDFRRGVDGLAQQCRAALAEDPFSGAVRAPPGVRSQARSTQGRKRLAQLVCRQRAVQCLPWC
jgi:hypothetical protein